MKQTITIGATPSEESCAQVGSENYSEMSQIECRVFRRQLERCHPIPLEAIATLVVAGQAHEFGTYREVAVRYDDCDEAATNYAFDLERNAPTQWDAIARYELAWFQTKAAYTRAIRNGSVTEAEIPPQYLQEQPVGEFSATATFSELLAQHPLQ